LKHESRFWWKTQDTDKEMAKSARAMSPERGKEQGSDRAEYSQAHPMM
jgi:hypothetical protein